MQTETMNTALCRQLNPLSQRGRAHIVDNRDNTREDVSALGRTVWEARATAFLNAVNEARTRNEREGWPRFVALRWRTLA